MNLKEIIEYSRELIATGTLDARAVCKMREALKALKFSYNEEKFPKLGETSQWTDPLHDTPGSLAEAYLWKLGKWKDYQRFVAEYHDENIEPKKTAVVMYGFARHLKDRSKPIYDQHAVRALWAIHPDITPDDAEIFDSVLLKPRVRVWKDNMSGKLTIEAYETFLRYMGTLAKNQPEGFIEEFDKFLMPLGQAIKKQAKTYQAFCQLAFSPDHPEAMN